MREKACQQRVKIIGKANPAAGYFKLSLLSPQICGLAKPGQFVMIQVNNGIEPLLRRPFSIHRVEKPEIMELLYEVVGKGTEILSQKRPGEYLDIIGPLGNGFDCYPPSPISYPLLVAGGMGVAPLVFLAERLAQQRAKNEKRKIMVLIGAKTKNQILCADEFKKLGCKVKVATDDGSRGLKGKVTDLLTHELSAKRYPRSAIIYACGPAPMLEEIGRISQRYNIAGQVSLEEHLACGIGACLGCVVNTVEGYKRVCKDGPVFDYRQIIW